MAKIGQIFVVYIFKLHSFTIYFQGSNPHLDPYILMFVGKRLIFFWMRHGNFEFLWHIFFLAVCSKIPLADLRSGFSVVLRASIFPLGTLAVRKLGRHVERPKTNLNSQKNKGVP